MILEPVCDSGDNCCTSTNKCGINQGKYLIYMFFLLIMELNTMYSFGILQKDELLQIYILISFKIKENK